MKNAASRGLGLILIFIGLGTWLLAYGYASSPASMALGYFLGTCAFAIGAIIFVVFSKEK